MILDPASAPISGFDVNQEVTMPARCRRSQEASAGTLAHSSMISRDTKLSGFSESGYPSGDVFEHPFGLELNLMKKFYRCFWPSGLGAKTADT